MAQLQINETMSSIRNRHKSNFIAINQALHFNLIKIRANFNVPFIWQGKGFRTFREGSIIENAQKRLYLLCANVFYSSRRRGGAASESIELCSSD